MKNLSISVVLLVVLMLASCVKDYEIGVAKYQVRNDTKDTVFVVIRGEVYHSESRYGVDRTIDFAREVAPAEEAIFCTSYDDDDDTWDAFYGMFTDRSHVEFMDSVVVYTSAAMDSCLFKEQYMAWRDTDVYEESSRDVCFYVHSDFWKDEEWTVEAGGRATYKYRSYTFLINDELIAKKGEEPCGEEF